ncbi:hypothetical protein ElyMa_002757500 [Elysia marginata]|uniref:Uncharacterized protein n=1 Tax=Elysia marginata TaxID=1093978 RepID=A0AAV4HI95_9GAST|nr:hypothetical protein ElyMa_002757500 [Elysia marginata]
MLLGISYIKSLPGTANEEVSLKIENAIGPHVDLLTIVGQWKLKGMGRLFAHLALPRLSCRVLEMEAEEEGGRRNAGKTTYENGHDLS